MTPRSDADRVPRRVWSATLMLALGRQWGMLCTLATLALLARVLEVGEFGRFTFYLALFAFGDVLADCGTSTVALQRGSSDPEAFAAAIAAGRRVRAGAALVAFALLAGTAAVFDPDHLAWIALAALAPFARVLELSSVVFQREIAWGLPVALRASGATLRFLGIVLVWLGGARGFGPFVAAHALALALGNVALHLAARARLPRRSSTESAARTSEILRSGLAVAAAGLLQQAYFYADNLFVRGLCSAADLGIYNAAMRILSALVAIAALATNAALPWLAREAEAGTLPRATARLARPLFAGACVVAALLWPFRSWLLGLLFGPGFEAGATSLAWLLATVPVVALGAPALTAVVASGRNARVLAISAAALALNLLLNAVLVPRHGIEGAAAATLATEAAVLVGALLVLRDARTLAHAVRR